MTWPYSLWLWIRTKLAGKPDDIVDSGYPNGTMPIPQDMHCPGEDTQRRWAHKEVQ